MRDEWSDTSETPIDVPIKVTISGSRTTQEVSLQVEAARLVVVVGDDVGKMWTVENEVLIGRGPQATVQINDSKVSRLHARIRRTDQHDLGFIIEDLGSRNGTMVNGIHVKTQALEFGDKIKLGPNTICIFTHYDHLEDRLFQLLKLESIGRLAGGVAHDFNNLLAVVQNNLNYLENLHKQENIDVNDALSCIDDMKVATRRAADLTRQLLGFAQRGKYSKEQVDLSTLLDEVVRLIRHAFTRAISIRLHIQPDLVGTGDRSQLHQVLMNLCINAQDAMPDGGQLSIKASLTQLGEEEALTLPSLRPGPYVIITVGDTGSGMDKETCQRIFEPFFTTKKLGKGSGLGLATAYGIVKNHGGHIEVESKINQGTQFHIYLPAAEALDEKMRAKATSKEMPKVGGKVLVVDDEVALLRSTKRLLTKLGYEVLCAGDGVEALELYQEHLGQIRFVILDMIMPRMGGRKVYFALREIDPDVKVIATSGYVEESRSQTLLDAGVHAFLPKPYTVEMLGKAIFNALSGKNG